MNTFGFCRQIIIKFLLRNSKALQSVRFGVRA
jgi:hypothetical protein